IWTCICHPDTSCRFQPHADPVRYHQYFPNHPGITIKGGSALRAVDMAPVAVSPMHRTVLTDYGVVLEAEAELELDSGEKRRLLFLTEISSSREARPIFGEILVILCQ